MKLPLAVRQLALLAREVLTLRQLLFNRFTLLLVVFLLIGGGMQGYVTANNDGQISGTVVGPDGDPVANANVTMRPIGSETVGSSQTTYTDDDGQFVFRDQTRVLEFSIFASKSGLGGSPEKRTHLYFRGQNIDVTLVITNATDDT